MFLESLVFLSSLPWLIQKYYYSFQTIHILLPRESVMFGLLCVPYEVLANIVGNIDFDDVFNLALTCKELKFLIEEESICKSIVQVSKFH